MDNRARTITHIYPAQVGTDPDHPPLPAVIDRIERNKVFIRPARPGEDPQSIEIEEEQVPIFLLEISHSIVEGATEPVRVVPDGREGNTVFARKLRPNEEDFGEVVQIVPAEEQIVVTNHVSHLGIHTSPEPGTDDMLLTSIRVVPDGREGSTVYMRSLRPGEPDTGETVQIRPGDHPVIRAHNLVLSLNALDECISPFDDGYRPLSNTIWTWMMLFGSGAIDWPFYLLAASRRLDASHALLRAVRDGLNDLDNPDMSVYQKRSNLYDIIGTVELMIVGLHRAMQLAARVDTYFDIDAKFPSRMVEMLETVRQIRNAYEHIDERSMKHVKQNQFSPDVLTVFEYRRLLVERVISYDEFSLSIDDEATDAFVTIREFLLDALTDLVRQVQDRRSNR